MMNNGKDDNKPRRDLREAGSGNSDDKRDTNNKPRKRLDRDEDDED